MGSLRAGPLSSVEITRTTALFPSAVFLQWNIESDETGVHLVDVFRAGAPNGPWEQIADSLRDAYSYLDDKFNLPLPQRPTDVIEGLHFFSLSRDVYYKVTVTPPSGNANAFSSVATPVEPGLDRRTRLFKRKILRDETIAFRALNGIQLVVLKRKHWGTRCRSCYDDGLREGTMEHCAECFGTTFEGGYWTAVLIRGRRSPGPVQTQMSAHGDAEVKKVSFIVLDFPHLEQNDLIIDIRRNDRFLVENVVATELKTVMVHQTVTASLIARSAVEYTILVDPYNLPPLY